MEIVAHEMYEFQRFKTIHPVVDEFVEYRWFLPLLRFD